MNANAARALRLFDEFVELPAAERERRLAALAAAEPELHAALRALLQADADDDAGVLDRSPARILADHRDRAAATASTPAPPAAADLRVGARLGAWRIDREIGRGRMGTVYQAHRDDGEYQQRVALKCVRAELDSPQALAALREERNLLARLDHTGIAALVDGGVDDAGRPWFALRYVEGEPIDAWCDRRRLGVAARVDLLLQVCDAVAYAHAQGVLHRDLKPSNVLVTGDGRAQLLDFGLSAQIGPLREAAAQPAAPTPHYAAPEARERGAQGPATDLYALGVLTYRLLAGQWPTPLHSLRELAPGAGADAPMTMALSLEDAPDAVAHARGAASAAALARQLRGDVSAVALKAVAVRAQDRYASVAEFADELRRWRQRRPVRALPGSWLSRTRKWLRRHPAAAGLGAALIVAAAAGLGVAGWQHRQAQREAEAGEQVGRLFASTLGTATLSGLGSTRFSSRALLERTERELRALPLGDQPTLNAHALATLARSYAQIGDYRRGEDLADQAQRLLDRAGIVDEENLITATRLSLLNRRGRYDEALALARQRLQELSSRDDEVARESRIAVGAELARTQWARGETLAALTGADDLLARAEALPRGHHELIAQVLILRSDFLRGLSRYKAAEDDAQRALELARPLNPVLEDDALERLVDSQRARLSPQYPANAELLLERRRRSLGATHPKSAQAEVYVGLNRYPNLPRADAARTLARLESAYGRDSAVYALALSRMAFALVDTDEAEVPLQREAVAILARDRSNQEMLFIAQLSLAQALIGRKMQGPPPNEREGVALLRRLIAARHRAGLQAPREQYVLINYLARYGSDAQLALARATLDQALRSAPQLYSPADAEWTSLRMLDNLVRYRQGQRAEADAGFERLLRETPPDGLGLSQSRIDMCRIVALLYRGRYAFETCRTPQAISLLRQAEALAQARMSPRDRTQADAVEALSNALAGRQGSRLPFMVRDDGHGALLACRPHDRRARSAAPHRGEDPRAGDTP
ncbi:protein kinase [Lysobacter enzymogenes]|uniref:protein kinase domain-containing protein n=1 Tax=Lysobacter enzymogenes TaxID=69 RepID=UPI00374A2B2D